MKSLLKTITTAIIFFTISCTKESLNLVPSQDIQTNDRSGLQASGHNVGERFGGGIIFYIDSTGEHGLIADTVDIRKAAWYNGEYVLTSATGTSIGTGRANTQKIKAAQGDSGRYAARLCLKHKASGYNDWFLPSKDELRKLWEERCLFSGWQRGVYWSSSEAALFFAWGENFAGDQNETWSKQVHANVRAVRAF